MIYDLVIIGGGPAGLSAALTACYLRLKHIVLEAGQAGGALTHIYPWKEVDSYLGFHGMNGLEVADKMIEHVKKEGSQIKEKERVVNIKTSMKDRVFTVVTEKKSYKTKTILFAPGVSGTPRKLGIPGEENPNICYSIDEPKSYRGKRVLVIGGGDSALEIALVLEKNGAEVYLAHRRERFRAMEKTQEMVRRSRIKILFNTELKEVFGKESIEKVKVINNVTNEETMLKVDNVVICIGFVLDLDFIKRIGVRIEGNRIPVDEEMRTNIEGVYAAGDITGRLNRLPEAIGEGHFAVYSIFKYLKKPYWA